MNSFLDVYLHFHYPQNTCRTSLDSNKSEAGRKSITESTGSKTFKKSRKRSSTDKSSISSSITKTFEEGSTLLMLLNTSLTHNLNSVETVLYKLTPRFVLQPGEQKKFRICFAPTKEADYSHNFTIEPTGWISKFKYHCEGRSEIPRIDISPKIEKIFVKGYHYRACVYTKEQNLLDFGHMVLCPGEKER